MEGSQIRPGGQIRPWDELTPDALGIIFSNLSLQEMLTVVPRVCKSWNKTVMGPCCWQVIDIEEWSCWRQPEQLDRMLQMLITRSCGSARKLCVSDLPNDLLFSYITDHAGSLQTLQLPGSKISDSIVEQVVGRLSTVTFLDLSYCIKIGARALEAFGNHCKLLVGLKRKMHPFVLGDKVCQDDEAHAIAATMPKLKHLEMANMLITTGGLHDILSSCQELEFLDLRGCSDVELDEKFLKKCSGLTVLKPLSMDSYYSHYFDDSDSFRHLVWEFIAGAMYDGESSDGLWYGEQRIEDLDLRFNEGFDDDAVFD